MAEITNARLLRIVPLLFAVCLVSLPAQAADGVSTYVFVSDQSTVLQTGGIAGVHRTYVVEGQFQLSVDPNAGIASFIYVDANAIDDSPYRHTLDPNEVFNMTGLVGTVIGDTIIIFSGKAADNSDILIIAILNNDLVYLVGQTFPPAGSADFFIFNLDAVAQRKYGGGSGSAENPYQIYAAEQMNSIGAEPNDWDKHFKLLADIDLAGYSYDSALIALDTNSIESDFQGTPFTGVFDGSGHTISFLTIVGKDYLGLFGQLASGAVVRDLGVVDVNITGSGNDVGAIVGCNGTSDKGGGIVTNCYSMGAVIGSERIGGLVGNNWGAVTQCYSTSEVNCRGYGPVGGLVGNNGGFLNYCYSTSAVSGHYDIGGLVGSNTALVTLCYSAGTVRGIRIWASSIGGLVGE
ncbi:MAG: GLUG motif-containing protein, partial [Phycisphaerae bacterium]